jgi:hypothetical protein
LTLELGNELYADLKELLSDKPPKQLAQYLTQYYTRTHNANNSGILERYRQLSRVLASVGRNAEFMEYFRNTQAYIRSRYGGVWRQFLLYMRYELQNILGSVYNERQTNGGAFNVGLMFPRLSRLMDDVDRFTGGRLPQPRPPHPPRTPLNPAYLPLPPPQTIEPIMNLHGLTNVELQRIQNELPIHMRAHEPIDPLTLLSNTAARQPRLPPLLL